MSDEAPGMQAKLATTQQLEEMIFQKTTSVAIPAFKLCDNILGVVNAAMQAATLPGMSIGNAAIASKGPPGLFSGKGEDGSTKAQQHQQQTMGIG